MVRKNAATLTQNEKEKFIAALVELKKRKEPGHTLSIYDEFVATHLGVAQLQSGPAAGIDGGHRGPAFLAWHREYIRRFEQALQSVDPDVSLHYWNWTYGDSSETAQLFSSDFIGGPGSGGTSGRDVQDGFVSSSATPNNPDGWKVPTELHPFINSTLRTESLQRATSLDPSGLPSESSVNTAMAQTEYSQFRPRLEQAHNSVHVWVNGHMAAMVSPIDPIFFMHHSNVDRLWTIWQQNHSGADNYNPGGTGGYGHRIDDKMWPWDGGDSAPSSQLQSLLPNIPAGDIRTPRDVLDISAMGYSYDSMSTGPATAPSTTTPSTTPTSNGSSRCFIATAAYGSELAPPVQFLRDFRDDTVIPSRFGPGFARALDAYYRFSPPIAKKMEQNSNFKNLMKYSIVYPFVGMAYGAAYLSKPFARKRI